VRALVVLSLFVAATTLSACGSGDPSPSRAGLDADERTWVRELAAWMQGLQGAATRAESLRLRGEPGTPERFEREAEPVRECRARLDDEPGDAPSSRLERVERLAVDACSQYARAVGAESRAFAGNPGEALAMADAAWAEGNRFWLEMERELELLLTWNRRRPVLGGDRETSRIEPRFGRIASRLANRPVQVRCWSQDDWPRVYEEWRSFANDPDIPAGFVASFDRGRLSLDPPTCAGLVRLAYRHDVPDGGDALLDVAGAVGVLAHEVEHLVSPASEAVTECRGMQAIREFARALGATPDEAARLAEAFWTEIYPTNDREYRTAQCRDGGTLDLDPARPVWP
jgi:hypothetical protein